MKVGEFLAAYELSLENTARERCSLQDNCMLLGVTVVGGETIHPERRLSTEIETMALFTCYEGCPLNKNGTIDILREAAHKVYEESGIYGETGEGWAIET